MKGLWIAALILCSAPTVLAQPISPDDARADEAIRDMCENRWPADFSMRAACVDIQREALRKLSRSSAPDRRPSPILIEKTDPGGVALFQQGPFMPTGIHDGYNRPLRHDRQDY